MIMEKAYPPTQEEVDIRVSDAVLIPDGGLAATGTITYPNGDRDILTLRYSDGWKLKWALTYDTSWYDISTALAAGPEGDLTVAGAVQDLDNPSDAFFKSYYTDYRVIRYSPDGKLQFESGGSGYDRNNIPVDAETSPDGGVFVTGAATNPQQTYDFIYTVRYLPDGGEAWQSFEDFGVQTHVAGLSLSVEGWLWVAAHAVGGQYELFDIMLVRYDPEDGKFSKQVKYEDLYFDYTASGIDTDLRGNVIVAGTTTQDVGHAFALKYDEEGGLLWKHIFDAEFDPTLAETLMTDSAGRVYVAGRVDRRVGFDDVLLYLLSPEGELIGYNTYTFDRECFPVAIMLDERYNVVLALSTVSPDMPGEAKFVKVEGWPLDRVKLTRREATGVGGDIMIHGGVVSEYPMPNYKFFMLPVPRVDSYHAIVGPGGNLPRFVYEPPRRNLDSYPIILEKDL